jgi:hypothetical protein
MKRWALVVAGIDCLMLAMLIAPMVALAFAPQVKLPEVAPVPTRMVARYRDYCCAGFLTFIGLTMGVSVMLFSFGPAVLLLYADRWRRLHPAPPVNTNG